MNFNDVIDGFGPRFKTILKKNGISQSKFGNDTGTHKGLISRYINGESPSGDFIMKAVSYFPNELNYLFFGDEISKVGEDRAVYSKSPEDIVTEIEGKLKELKSVIAQNQHK